MGASYNTSRPMAWRISYVLHALQRGPVSVARLARGWEVSYKTIQRDIDFLRNVGVTVNADHRGCWTSDTHADLFLKL